MGYSNFTRKALEKEFLEALDHLRKAERIMKGAGETVEKMAKMDTIIRKVLLLKRRIEDGIE